MHPAFRKQLLAWYTRHARELPWRSRPTPYRVWVSEIMLQQTRVEAVRDYFKRFMKRFPGIRGLAAAPLEDVLQAWSGLGYYRRARMLHAAAQQIVEQHNGRFPRERKDVLALPGVGPYSAGAILSIAFGRPEPIVDGNVERVFARLTALDANVKTDGKATVWELATEHVAKGAAEGHAPGQLNQALMELGATVCTPANPRCDTCPVARHCKARAAGDVNRYPLLPRRAPSKTRRYLFAAVTDDAGRVLLRRRPDGDKGSLLPGGLWEMPHVEWKRGKQRALAALAESIGSEITTTGRPVTCAHTIMDYRLTLALQRCNPESTVGETVDHRWFAPGQARNAAIASATRKLLKALSENS